MPAPARRRRVLARAQTPPAVLAGMVALYIGVFGPLTWAQQSNFGTFGFDMGIYDQAIWLLSRARTPFVTVRGLNYFGHHVNLITLLLVPAYWLGGGPHFLYLFETMALAAGAVPVWLLARDELDNAWLALGLAAAYLLYPSLQWINWWHFHPDALTITPLLFAWWFARNGRWRWCVGCVLVALLCKEDAALAVAALGAVIAWRQRRQRPAVLGLAMFAAGLGWFVICTKVIIPAANGGQGAFYESSFPALGNSIGSIVTNAVVHPSRVWHLVTAADRHTYYVQLLAPVAFLVVGSGLALVGIPQLLVNVSSGISYTHDIKYHYSALVLVGVFLATIETCRRIGRTPALRRFLVGVVAASALAANVAWSPSPLGVKFHSGIWAQGGERVRELDQAVHVVPADAGVSATYSIVPHLTHRVHIYEWPNPFVTANWGIDDRHPDPPTNVNYLVLDTQLNQDHADLYAALTGPGGPFVTIFQEGSIVVARRVPITVGGAAARPGGAGGHR